MRIERRSTLAGAKEAQGIVVVIDVLRVFTCAAMMFNYGATELVLVATADEAFEFRRRYPHYLIAGEIGGKQVDGFDLGNSPTEIIERGERYFKGRKVVLRSSAGTQGATTLKANVQEIIVTGYLTASAVARYIRNKKENGLIVTLLAMGSEGKIKSIEDECCGDYIEHLLTDTTYDQVNALRECLHDPLIAGSLRGDRPHLPSEDIVFSLQRDLFDFVMLGERTGDMVILKAIGNSLKA
jgi:2-phosphosulfolactate phosphatase